VTGRMVYRMFFL